MLAVVANYGFSVQADQLKVRFSGHIDTILIDNSSPVPPRHADLILPNSYYTGLWNAAVGAAIMRRKDWLLFVASDVEVPDVDKVMSLLLQACANRTIGLYTPALRTDSRLAYPACYERGSGAIRECYVCEGFFFLVRTKIASRIYPVDPSVNLYGWGIDAFTAYITYASGYQAVVDDRAVIHHPAAIHDISTDEANAQVGRYLPPEVLRFLLWSEAQLRNQSSALKGGLGMKPRVDRLWWRIRELIRRSR